MKLFAVDWIGKTLIKVPLQYKKDFYGIYFKIGKNRPFLLQLSIGERP